MYQAPHGRLIEVTTMRELSLGRPKSGRGRLIELAAYIGIFFILFYNYFGGFDY